MCRPIESRNPLCVPGPAAVAMLANYQLTAINNMVLVNQNVQLVERAAKPVWPAAGEMGIGADDMTMLNTTAPAFPVVSFPKHESLPMMPWGATAPTEVGLCNMGIPTNQFAPNSVPSEVMVSSKMTQPSFEAQEMKEMLDFSIPSGLHDVGKDKLDVVNVDDGGFTGTEMSILYSCLVDGPEDESQQDVEVDSSGKLDLTVPMRSAIQGLIKSSRETEFTSAEVMKTPVGLEHHVPGLKDTKSPGEVKSRRLCKSEGCYKRSRSNSLCISHGGGRRCAVEGCDKCSQGGNLCIRHGGGKRCSHENCDKAAQSNFLCKAHGGGPRCRFTGCTRSSQGGGFCRSHGGGKRCVLQGCKKGTQRGDYCSLHGGSRMCEVPGCLRNDRGGGLCATHGGGKRCTVGSCNKPCRRKGMCSAHLRQSEGGKE